MSFDTESLFSKLQKRQEMQSANTGTFSSDPYLLKLKPGNNYSLRLLWLPPYGTCKREYPMINQYVHKYWDDDAPNGEKNNIVYCPTSQYIKDETKAGFDSCPICAECSKLYKQHSASESANRMYNLFKRTFVGYIPVYVVNGPKEDIGQVKIFKYGKMFKKFFDRKIFGRVTKSINGEEAQPLDPDEVIGLEAFMYEKNDEIITEGVNLNIQVTTKKVSLPGKNAPIDMPEYAIDFSRKTSNIIDFNGSEITVEMFRDLNKEINFDNNYYLESSTADLQKFAMKFLSIDTPTEKESTPTVTVAPKEETKVITETAPTNTDNKEDDDIDLDKLIDGL